MVRDVHNIVELHIIRCTYIYIILVHTNMYMYDVPMYIVQARTRT